MVYAVTEEQARQARNAAYRAGLCAECKTVKHSAGRPRCNQCHNRHNPAVEARADRNQYPCHMCGDPTRPGNVLCAPCFKQLKQGVTR
jgi:hypothetical protein